MYTKNVCTYVIAKSLGFHSRSLRVSNFLLLTSETDSASGGSLVIESQTPIVRDRLPF